MALKPLQYLMTKRDEDAKGRKGIVNKTGNINLPLCKPIMHPSLSLTLCNLV